MIEIKDIPSNSPYTLFNSYFEEAKKANQNPINAIAISSYNPKLGEVTSRFVNLKYIVKDEWTFFTNYLSPKAKDLLKKIENDYPRYENIDKIIKKHST